MLSYVPKWLNIPLQCPLSNLKHFITYDLISLNSYWTVKYATWWTYEFMFLWLAKNSLLWEWYVFFWWKYWDCIAAWLMQSSWLVWHLFFCLTFFIKYYTYKPFFFKFIFIKKNKKITQITKVNVRQKMINPLSLIERILNLLFPSVIFDMLELFRTGHSLT